MEAPPATAMNCEDARRALSALIGGPIGLTDWALLEAHLKQCARCRQAEAHLRQLAAASRPVTPSHAVLSSLRKAMELATVGVAVTHVPGAETRIVLGAVAPTPLRARHAEDLLRGKRLTDELIAKAAQAAVAESRPISNVRASAEYRREMVGVLTRRALEQLR